MSFFRRRHERKGGRTGAPVRVGFLAKLTQRRARQRAAAEARERAAHETRERMAAEVAAAAAQLPPSPAKSDRGGAATDESDTALFAAAAAADDNVTVFAGPAAPARAKTRSCVVCRKDAAQHCGRCKVSYCSRECQAWHWQNGHSQQCRGSTRGGSTASGGGAADRTAGGNVRLPGHAGTQNDPSEFHGERSLADVMKDLAFTDEGEALAFLRRAGYATTAASTSTTGTTNDGGSDPNSSDHSSVQTNNRNTH